MATIDAGQVARDHIKALEERIAALEAETADLNDRLEECCAACARYILDASKAKERIAALEAEAEAWNEDHYKLQRRIAALEAALDELVRCLEGGMDREVVIEQARETRRWLLAGDR